MRPCRACHLLRTSIMSRRRARVFGCALATSCCGCAVCYLVGGRSSRPAPPGDPTHGMRHYPRCSWDDDRARWLPAENNSSPSHTVQQFADFLEQQIAGALGYEYTLLDGSLLGAMRHGGLIPSDRDLDAVILLPLNASDVHLDAGIQSLFTRIEQRLSLTGHPFRLELSDAVGGDGRWLRLVPWVPEGGEQGWPVVADLHVYPSSRLDAAHSTWAGIAFAALCRCRFAGRQLSCFEHADRFLSSVYGVDFMTRVSGEHRQEHKLRSLLDAEPPYLHARRRADTDTGAADAYAEAVVGATTNRAAATLASTSRSSATGGPTVVTPHPSDGGARAQRPARLRRGGGDAAVTVPVAENASGDGHEAWCRDIKGRAHVVPGADWGSLTEAQQAQWKGRRCDRFFCKPNPMEARGTYRCMPVTIAAHLHAIQ